MRTVSQTAQFKKDFKRVAKGPHRATLEEDLRSALAILAQDLPLAERCHDHPLTGNYTEHRECHLKSDLLLIYKKPDLQTLRLVRIGSHSELF